MSVRSPRKRELVACSRSHNRWSTWVSYSAEVQILGCIFSIVWSQRSTKTFSSVRSSRWKKTFSKIWKSSTSIVTKCDSWIDAPSSKMKKPPVVSKLPSPQMALRTSLSATKKTRTGSCRRTMSYLVSTKGRALASNEETYRGTPNSPKSRPSRDLIRTCKCKGRSLTTRLSSKWRRARALMLETPTRKWSFLRDKRGSLTVLRKCDRWVRKRSLPGNSLTGTSRTSWIPRNSSADTDKSKKCTDRSVSWMPLNKASWRMSISRSWISRRRRTTYKRWIALRPSSFRKTRIARGLHPCYPRTAMSGTIKLENSISITIWTWRMTWIRAIVLITGWTSHISSSSTLIVSSKLSLVIPSWRHRPRRCMRYRILFNRIRFNLRSRLRGKWSGIRWQVKSLKLDNILKWWKVPSNTTRA